MTRTMSAADYREQLLDSMPERDWRDQVVSFARHRGWLVYWTWRSDRSPSPRWVSGEKYDFAYALANRRSKQVCELTEKLRAAESEAATLRARLEGAEAVVEAAPDVLELATGLAEDFISDGHRWRDADTAKLQRLDDALAAYDSKEGAL